MSRGAVAVLALSLAACAAVESGGTETDSDDPSGEFDPTTTGSASGNVASAVASSGAGGAGGSETAGTGGGAQSGACMNSPDMLILKNQGMVEQQVHACAQQHLGQEPATKDCIEQSTKLSDPCATCFDETVHCAIQSCASECLGGPSAACQACMDQHCMPAFDACSGL
jgi:hypothetical protein